MRVDTAAGRAPAGGLPSAPAPKRAFAPLISVSRDEPVAFSAEGLTGARPVMWQTDDAPSPPSTAEGRSAPSIDPAPASRLDVAAPFPTRAELTLPASPNRLDPPQARPAPVTIQAAGTANAYGPARPSMRDARSVVPSEALATIPQVRRRPPQLVLTGPDTALAVAVAAPDIDQATADDLADAVARLLAEKGLGLSALMINGAATPISRRL